MTTKELCKCSNAVEDVISGTHILRKSLTDDNLEKAGRKSNYKEVIKRLKENLESVETMCGLKLTAPEQDIKDLKRTIFSGKSRMMERSQLEDAQSAQEELSGDLLETIYTCGD